MDDMKYDVFRGNREVWAATGSEVTISAADIEFLRGETDTNLSHKSRILLHGDPSGDLHEMIIAHTLGQYVRPHINDQSAKSYLVLSGEMMVVFFEEKGSVRSNICLEQVDSGNSFFVRINIAVYHTVIPLSEKVVFIETSKGPHSGTRFASFAPLPSDSVAVEKYNAWLMGEVGLS